MEKKFALSATKKINIPTLVLSEKQFLNETKNHNPPPPCKLNGRSLTKFICTHPLCKVVIENNNPSKVRKLPKKINSPYEYQISCLIKTHFYFYIQ